jgi:hypothetical protein
VTKETSSLKDGLTWGLTLDSYRKGEGSHKSRRQLEKELYGEGILGDALTEARSGALAERFTLPPLTVLSAREGWWQDRKRAWAALGIQSELGRGENEPSGGLTAEQRVKIQNNKTASPSQPAQGQAPAAKKAFRDACYYGDRERK